MDLFRRYMWTSDQKSIKANCSCFWKLLKSYRRLPRPGKNMHRQKPDTALTGKTMNDCRKPHQQPAQFLLWIFHQPDQKWKPIVLWPMLKKVIGRCNKPCRNT